MSESDFGFHDSCDLIQVVPSKEADRSALDDSTDGEHFCARTGQFATPALKSGDIVVVNHLLPCLQPISTRIVNDLKIAIDQT